MTTTNSSHITPQSGRTNTLDIDDKREETPTLSSVHVRSNDMDIELSPFGDVNTIRVGNMQVSQYAPSAHDRAISGLWLRRHEGSTVEVVPLIGSQSNTQYHITQGETGDGESVIWNGSGLGVDWSVQLRQSRSCDSLSPFSQDTAQWLWEVTVIPESARENTSENSVKHNHNSATVPAETILWDVVSAQDLALAPTVQALSSEPYISQYIAYHAEREQGCGTVLVARQTMACAPQLPLFTAGIVEGCAGYLTDGFDFYGRDARLGSAPKALFTADWRGGHVNQYEFGMACLVSEPRKLENRLTWRVVESFTPDYRGELSEACASVAEGISAAARKPETTSQPGDLTLNLGDSATKPTLSLLASAPLLNGEPLSDEDFLALGGDNIDSVEKNEEGHILSYFSDRAEHVVSREKELLVERSHGQILLANGTGNPETPVLAATTYAPGVFASHIVLGNTNMNRLVSVHRTSLNLLRSQGVRILVRVNGQWRLLGVPSAYIMDIGGSRWVYVVDDVSINVSTTASAENNTLSIALESSISLDAIISIDIENSDDWELSERATQFGNTMILQPKQSTPTAQHCPGLSYVFASQTAVSGNDSALFVNDCNGTGTHIPESFGTGVLTFEAQRTQACEVAVSASLEGTEEALSLLANHAGQVRSREQELESHFNSIHEYAQALHVEQGGRLNEFNMLLPWLVQNARVHFLSPHGLEQYSGAAWGTRDVCQGPFELALAFGHYDEARTIIRKVFAHQNTDGSLPQWFMFDEYANMYQKDSHGDIPVWPLMAVAQYLDATSDYSILIDEIGFWDREKDAICDSHSTVIDHLKRTVAYISSHRVPGTELFSYGEGDWDDTLQPAQASMKKEMTSTWTIALLYQAAHSLAELLQAGGQHELAEEFEDEAHRIQSVFANDFMFNGILAGYVSFADGTPAPIIHPDDKRTGIQYRLIPMTRSIIAGLLPPEKLQSHEAIVNEHLHYPDGVRLMNRPAAFHDGITTVFKRAEQSANVGREIGLMYTHAHIRYAEALGLLGSNTLGTELLRISPVGQFDRLATSEPRQRNCYFASSDADFPDRYTAAEQWNRLREDSPRPVGVKGGWRVYSSGPGIYIRQVVQHLFGIQLHADRVVFDPVLDEQDNNLHITVSLFNAIRTIRYHVVSEEQSVTVELDGTKVEGRVLSLPYRQGGVELSAEALGDARIIDITVGGNRRSSRQ